ncbi:Cytochrome b5-like Heme/Steroid binding domain family protein [Candida parapsilosis]|uniref:Cytochrome b5 heme-binding domain-containing protein n=2 Tax=Candida parapsilosis TaxID=5480 RepID=G8B7D6_CANPC|nr:uncharacterized protein CPAR2_104080 [Candida parapsilosis]KAF6048350.1 Cytochrome b5-like Heme/Steroid binding domain family protein [Candida parapsilosis]KAF6049684.1 Cytochrome b5-like Heme/Steroid binding domain family protein [Candida parapsilosis]KAF6057546.1 Cytochrome b5-like Heme/Steroid binding domain family protein [Candida parapsilosis]KAF6065746.1 Cytochrome b5-like Heme/Steroid binding domain family protein [Candida parapsilosis]KAI5905163.1 Damage response protein 1 [Candida 
MFGDKNKEPTEIFLDNEKIDLDSLPILSRKQLSKFNGTDDAKLYVAIKGYVYDVTANTKSYGPGKAYNKLVGKDVGRLLGLNKLQLKEEDGRLPDTWDLSDLTEKQLKIVDDWIVFFKMRYPIVALIQENSN